MGSLYKRLLDLIPRQAEFVGTITFADHPQYKVLVVDGSGLVECSSATRFELGDRVFVQGLTIVRKALDGDVLQIEV